MASAVIQAVIVAQSALKAGRSSMRLALFDEDGAVVSIPNIDVMPVQAATTAADLDALKVDFNALLTKLKNAGLMASS